MRGLSLQNENKYTAHRKPEIFPQSTLFYYVVKNLQRKADTRNQKQWQAARRIFFNLTKSTVGLNLKVCFWRSTRDSTVIIWRFISL